MSWTLERLADARPHRIAAIEGERRWSYATWNAQADAMAAALRARGVTPGAVVAVHCRIRLEWLAVASALGKLGARMLGVNWRLTNDELAFLLDDSGAVAFVTDADDPGALAPALPARIATAVSIAAAAPGMARYEDLVATPGERVTASGDAPLVLYTSGTTGRPKGVVTHVPTHPDDLTRMLAFRDAYDVALGRAADDVTLLTLPLHHGAGPSQVRAALRAGNRLVLQRRYDPAGVLDLIEAHRVTLWAGVPTMVHRIAQLPEPCLRGRDLSSLRILALGAAPLPPELKAWASGFFGTGVVHEGYGMTETGMITHIGPDEVAGREGSVGRALAHVDIAVRDDAGRPLPPGTPGHLWLRTPATLRAYVNHPPLGADELDADGFFNSGDVGRLDPDGYLFLTDRAKDMVIAGGVNIYPAEIERIARGHPGVADAAAVGAPDPDLGERVVLFVEAEPDTTLDPAAIAATLARDLAAYKRPRDIRVVARLPRNPMGKVLKRELRAPLWPQPQDEEHAIS